LHTEHKVSLRQACILLKISSSVYYYKPIIKDDNPIIGLLTRLADEHSRWGFWMMYHHLRNMGHTWNHKRVYRVYLALDMNIRRKHKKRLPARVKESLVLPIGPNITWSMDCMILAPYNFLLKYVKTNTFLHFNRKKISKENI